MTKSKILTCPQCKIEFTRLTKDLNRTARKNTTWCCSIVCRNKFLSRRKEVTCLQCKSSVTKRLSDIGDKNFCNRSCSAKYHNAHKTTGTNVSKLEKWLQIKLQEIYPNIIFVFNSPNEVGLELDIYLPELKLAFELNGIFHYEPIFGQDKLNRTQFNDNQKYQACIAKEISLCVIDTSKHRYFKESTCKPYLDIITSIIDKS